MEIIDDHVSFADVGVPVGGRRRRPLRPHGPGFDGMGEFHHANTDTMARVSQQSLEIVGKTMLLTVELLDK